MKKLLINTFFIFIIFQNIIFTYINFPSFFRYWDEAVLFLVILAFIVCRIKKRNIKVNKKSFIIICMLLSMIVIGILGNIFFRYVTSVNIIFRDIVNFLKFPLTFILIKEIKLDEVIVKNLSKNVEKIIKIMIIIIFSCGVLNLFWDIGMSHGSDRAGISPFKFLYSHPTYLVLSSILMFSYMQTLEKKKSNLVYEILLMGNIIFSMRTKGIVTIAIFAFIKYAPKAIKKIKLLYITLIGIVGGAMAYNKLMLYQSFSTSPREVLYIGALNLIKKCFPLGSGFGTYASHLSVEADSRVYDFVKVPLYNATELVYGDAGFAYYLGQFGLIGTILFGIIGFFLYRLANENVKNKLPAILLFIYIIVALTSETILVNNGIELAIMLSIVSCKCRIQEKKEKK